MKIDVSVAEIQATAETYNSDPYYIGLFKNDEPNTTEAISDFTITKSVEWIKDASLGEKSPYGDYYPLTYKVDENTETSPRSGIITVTYGPANKSIEYQITQAANTSQGPTEPTLNEYVFQITNYESNKNYSLQVRGHSADPDNNVSFATIKANDINDSTSLNIDIKIALAATNDTTGKDSTFAFIIRGDGFEFDSSIDNPRPSSWKSVVIMHGGERKGRLNVGRSTTVSGGLGVQITIFSNNQDPKSLALLSEDTLSKGVLSNSIEGTIAIKNSTHVIHVIPFKVTFGFS